MRKKMRSEGRFSSKDLQHPPVEKVHGSLTMEVAILATVDLKSSTSKRFEHSHAQPCCESGFTAQYFCGTAQTQA